MMRFLALFLEHGIQSVLALLAAGGKVNDTDCELTRQWTLSLSEHLCSIGKAL